jgi:hypothetical protein
MSTKNTELTRAEIRAADKLLECALQPRAIPFFSPEERLVLAILAANYSQRQRARGKKSKGTAKVKAEYRRNHVNLLLRYVVEKKYRTEPKTLMTVMKIIEWLDEIGIEANESQVRRDIHATLKLGDLPTW